MSPGLSISALLYKANGREFTSGQYTQEHRKEEEEKRAG